MKHSIWGKRALAAAGVVALSLPAIAGTASALELPTTDGGTLNIHKYEWNGTATTTDRTGTTADATNVPQGAKPLAGVKFKATALCLSGNKKIDLKTAAGWDAIGSYKTADEAKAAGLVACTGTDAESVESAATGADGNTSISLTKSTLYLVTESVTPQSPTVTTRTPDFLVTMPMANSNGTGWNTVVDVYPKNSTADAPKKVLTDASQIGTVASANDKLQWKATATLPGYPSGATKFTEVSLSDTFAADLGTPAASGVNVGNVYLGGDQAANLLTKDTDYTVTVTNQTIKISLTATGLAKAKPGQQLIAILNSKLAVGAGTSVTNGVDLFTKTDAPGDEGTTTPTPDDNKGKVNRGSFKITKSDKKDATKLAGAVFKVCEADAAGTACKDSTFVKTQGNTEDATFTTDSDGVVSGTLLIDYTKDGATGAPATSKAFCAVEQTAPSGYVKDASPKCFTVTSTSSLAAPVAVGITNVKGNQWLPNLPVTGAQGLMLLTLGGASLAAIAVGSAVVIRRRQH